MGVHGLMTCHIAKAPQRLRPSPAEKSPKDIEYEAPSISNFILGIQNTAEKYLGK